MRKLKLFFIGILSLFCMLICFTACDEKNSRLLSGTYTFTGDLNQMSYTFDEENNFTVRYFMNGFSVYSQTGKYEIEDDRSTITLSFSTADNFNIPNSVVGLSGEFFFKREDDQISIGNKCYQKNGTLRQGATDLQEGEDILQDSDDMPDSTELYNSNELYI